MKLTSLSIRNKLFLFVTFISAISLISYLVMALATFQNDKISSAFESSGVLASTVGAQVKTHLRDLSLAVQPLTQDYIEEEDFSDKSISNISLNPEFKGLAMIDTVEVPNSMNLGLYIEMDDGKVESVLRFLTPNWSDILARLNEKNHWVSMGEKADELIVFEKVNVIGRKAFVQMLILQNSAMADFFAGSQKRQILLINKNTEILAGPPDLIGKNLSKIYKNSSFGNPDNLQPQGSEQAKGVKEEDRLMSYSNIGFYDLYVVVILDQKEIFSAFSDLIRKAVLFFLMLTALTFVIGIFATKGMTRTLTQLLEACREMSQGNFKKTAEIISEDEIGVLANAFNDMNAQVKRLLEKAEDARIKADLERKSAEAKNTQNSSETV